MIKNAFDRIKAKLDLSAIAIRGAVTHEGTGTAAMTTSGTPAAATSIRVEVMASAANLAAATASLAYSLDGGDTWSATVAVPLNGVVALGASGVTATFADGTFVDGDMYTLQTYVDPPLPMYLGRQAMITPGVMPRVVMAPASGKLMKGGRIKYTDPDSQLVTAEHTTAHRTLNFVFWVQHRTYDDTERATAQLLKAILDAGFRFKVGTEDWRDEQIGEGQGVTNIVMLEFDGAYLNPATWATLDTILMTRELVD